MGFGTYFADKPHRPIQNQLHICLREPTFLYGQLSAVNLPVDLLYGLDELLLKRVCLGLHLQQSSNILYGCLNAVLVQATLFESFG